MAPMLSTFGGGSARGFGSGLPSGGGGAFSPTNPVSAFVFMGDGGFNATQLANVRTNLMAANSDLGYPSGTVIDVFAGGNGSVNWEQASNNTYSASSNSTMNGYYDGCSIGNGSGTNTYATDFCRYLATQGKGFAVHIFITGEYQSSTVYGSGSSIPSSMKIFASGNYGSANGVPQSVSNVNQPFCNGLTSLVVPSGQYWPQGGLSTLNGSTGFGNGFDGNYMMTAKNAASGQHGRLFAASHHTYKNNTTDSWNTSTHSYSQLTAPAKDTLKHIVQYLYWVCGEMADI